MVGLSTVFLLCIIAIIIIPLVATPAPVLMVEKLSEKPQHYFTVTNPDPILAEAITHPGQPIQFNSLSETQIDELTSKNDTPNFEYQNTYYVAGIPMVEPLAIYGQIMLISFVGILISGIALITLIIISGTRYFKNRMDHI